MRICRLWFRAALVAAMFVYGLVVVAVLMPLLNLAGFRTERLFDRIRLNWHRILCRILNVTIEISGLADPRAGLLVANHISWLDILVMGTHRPLVFVAKREVAGWPVLGYLARRSGTLFIQRGDSAQTDATREQMTWMLRQGKRLMLFPEGTTTSGDRVLRFHAKLFQPACLAQVPVQAVAIEYAGPARSIAPFVGDDAFLPHLLRILALDHVSVHLHFCPAQSVGTPRDALAQITRRQVIESLVPEVRSVACRSA